jgi:hypothetical protein
MRDRRRLESGGWEGVKKQAIKSKIMVLIYIKCKEKQCII